MLAGAEARIRTAVDLRVSASTQACEDEFVNEQQGRSVVAAALSKLSVR